MAQATAVITFTQASGLDGKAFTWTPALTNPTPKVLSHSVAVPAGQNGCSAYIDGVPTNLGGTVRISGPTDCTVTLVASD